MALTAMEPCEALPQPKSKAAIHFVDSSCKKAHTACDRCRMKKSKCDGARPCSRCRAKNFACVTQLRHKARPNAYTREYVETLEKQQVCLTNAILQLYRLIDSGAHWPGVRPRLQPDGEPIIDDLLSRLGAISQVTKEYTKIHSGADGRVPEGISHAITKCTKSPVRTLSCLSSTSNGSDINPATPSPRSTVSSGFLGGETWESSSSFNAGQVAQGFINPLALHTMEVLPCENLAPAYEADIENGGKYSFTEDPDLLLLNLNAHVFMNCGPMATYWASKNEETELPSTSLVPEI